jgi:hypothetical protein
MLDNIGLELSSVGMAEYNQIIKNLQVERPEDSEKMIVKWNGMHISYYPNVLKLTIANSLHKLYNLLFNDLRNNNSNDFHLADCNALTDCLSIVYFNRSPKEFRVCGGLEFGMNIDTGEIKPFDIVDRWLSYNGKQVFPAIPPKGKPIQKMSCHSDYRIKGYDKGIQSGLNGIINRNILRYEIVVHQPRKIRQILSLQGNSFISLEEVNHHDAWVSFYRHLMNTYDKISKAPLLKEGIGEEDINFVHGYINHLMANDRKLSMNKSSYNKWRAKAKNVYFKYDKSELNVHNFVRRKLEQKFIDISN